MVGIFAKVDDAAKRYGAEGNYVAGANIAGFEKVAKCYDRYRIGIST